MTVAKQLDRVPVKAYAQIEGPHVTGQRNLATRWGRKIERGGWMAQFGSVRSVSQRRCCRHVLVVALSVTLVVAAMPSASAALLAGSSSPDSANCNDTDGHVRAVATSGSGTTIGTGMYTYTWDPNSISIGNPKVDFTDEATWVINSSPGSTDELEGGYFTGAGGTEGDYTSKIVAYFTENDGQQEMDFYNDTLAGNTKYWVDTRAESTGSDNVAVGPYNLDPGDYPVNTPRLNYEQGEVNVAGVTMSGGGDEIDAYYRPENSSTYYPWTFNHECVDDSPSYSTTNQGANEYFHGGQ
jgi:hypothetical protein